MSAPAAIARRRPARTVAGMTPTDPTFVERYQTLLRAIAGSGARGAPLLLFSLLTVTRPYEILSGDVHVAAGRLKAEPVQFSGVATKARDVPLGAIAAALLGGRDGAVVELLELPVVQRGAVLRALREELVALEIPESVNLEELHLIAAAAVMAGAPDDLRRQAVLAYAGIPAQSGRARRRWAAADGLVGWAADAIDAQAAAAGLAVRTPTAGTAQG